MIVYSLKAAICSGYHRHSESSGLIADIWNDLPRTRCSTITVILRLTCACLANSQNNKSKIFVYSIELISKFIIVERLLFVFLYSRRCYLQIVCLNEKKQASNLTHNIPLPSIKAVFEFVWVAWKGTYFRLFRCLIERV